MKVNKLYFSFAAIILLALFLVACGKETATETEQGTEQTATVSQETATQDAIVTVEQPIAEESTETTEAIETTEATDSTEITGETTDSSESIYEGTSQAGCTDSDGGQNYDLAGSIVDARGVTDYDRCSENENFPGKLYESYCKETGDHGRETYDCPSGKCQAGACVAAEEVTE